MFFMISNKYYNEFFELEEQNGKRKAKKTGSSSFEFTSYLVDARNKTRIE